MCGRYSHSKTEINFARNLSESRQLSFVKRYNVAPTQLAEIIRAENGGISIAPVRWGLIPSWAKDEKIGYQCINARLETVKEKPSFRSAFKKRRCLVPADGFYECQKIGKEKQPMRFVLPDRDIFFFAGLWESWRKSETETVDSFTIITTAANNTVTPVHDRMPFIVSPEHYDAWLDPASAAFESVLQIATKRYNFIQ